jgi:hypothetical protein
MKLIYDALKKHKDEIEKNSDFVFPVEF